MGIDIGMPCPAIAGEIRPWKQVVIKVENRDKSQTFREFEILEAIHPKRGDGRRDGDPGVVLHIAELSTPWGLSNEAWDDNDLLNVKGLFGSQQRGR